MIYSVLDWFVLRVNLFRLAAAFSPAAARRYRRIALIYLVAVLSGICGVLAVSSLAARAAHG